MLAEVLVEVLAAETTLLTVSSTSSSSPSSAHRSELDLKKGAVRGS